MKALFTLCLCLAASSPALAQSSDIEHIQRTVTHYLEGGTNNDFDVLSRAFHPTATMRFIGQGYTDVNVLDYFRERMRPGPRQERQTRITSIDVSGNAASARLEIEYPTFTFIDYMSLLKIDGEWLIVSKVYYKRVHQRE